MKNRIGLALLSALTITGCAAPQELVVNIKKNRAEEALAKANQRGVAIGYELRRSDMKEGYSLLRYLDDSTALQSDFNIKILIDRSQEPHRLKMTGSDASQNNKQDKVRDHMERIAEDVKQCCGIPEPGE